MVRRMRYAVTVVKAYGGIDARHSTSGSRLRIRRRIGRARLREHPRWDAHRADPRASRSSTTDLVEFGRSAGTISPSQARRLVEEAGRQPARAAAVLRRAIALREAIWRVFDAFAKNARAEPADLALIHEEELAALRHARLQQSGSDVELRMVRRASAGAAALGDRALGRGAASLEERARTCPRMRLSNVRMAVHRQEPQSQPAVVRHERLRECRQGAPLPAAAARAPKAKAAR